MLPEDIEAAAREATLGISPLALATPNGEAGELVVATSASSTLKRLVGVLNRDDDTQTFSIQLVTNVLEAATDLDVIVRSADSRLPFDLLLQGELYGPIFVEQVEGRFGSIPQEMLTASSLALATDGDSLSELEVGLPLGDAGDPRRRFKEAELDDLEALVVDCRNWLAGERSSQRVVDPELLLPPAAGTSQDEAVDQFLELLDVLNRMPLRDLTLPSELLALFSEAGLLDELFRWRSDFGMDVSRVMTRFRISETIGDLPDVEAAGSFRPGALRRTDVILEKYIKAIAQSSSSLDLETIDRCWGSGPKVLIFMTKEDRYCRVRPQLEAA